MATYRLTANAKGVTFVDSETQKITFSSNGEIKTDKGKVLGNTFTKSISKNKIIGTFDINHDFTTVPELSLEEAKKFRNLVDMQMAEIAAAYKRNAQKGFVGGYPVIKGTGAKDADYKNREGFIPRRKNGEFNGVINDAIFVGNVKRKDAVEGKTKAEQNQPGLLAKAIERNDFKNIFQPLFDELAMYASKGNPQITKEQLHEMIVQNNVLFKALTNGFGVNANETRETHGETLANGEVETYSQLAIKIFSELRLNKKFTYKMD